MHIFAPTTPTAFLNWAGLRSTSVQDEFRPVERELLPVRTPVGEEWILAKDEATFRQPAQPPAPARLLPSGDTYWVRWGVDRALLVADPINPNAALDAARVAGRRSGRGRDSRDLAAGQ